MNVCTEKTIDEFLKNRNSRITKRDSITSDESKTNYKLWDSNIVVRDLQTNSIYLSDCGYKTATTSERLNAFLSHFNAIDWNGNSIHYTPSIGFYIYSERANKKDASKKVIYKKVINESQIMIDFYNGKLLAA